MTNRPPMQFYPSKWITDTQHLSGAEEIAYFRLVLDARERSDDWCSVPGEDARLARIARVTPREWKAVGPNVRAFWTPRADGRLEHPFLRQLADRDRRWLDQKSAAGRASAAQRTGNDRSTDVPTTEPTDGQRTTNDRGRFVSRAAFASAFDSSRESPPAAARARATPTAATPTTPARRRRRADRSARKVRPITDAHIAAAAERFSLPLDQVQVIADRIRLEAEERGYTNLPSALLNWCQRETPASSTKPNGAHRDRRGKPVFYGEPEPRGKGAPGVPDPLSWGECGHLGTMQAGEWRRLTPDELAAWQNAVMGRRS